MLNRVFEHSQHPCSEGMLQQGQRLQSTKGIRVSLRLIWLDRLPISYLKWSKINGKEFNERRQCNSTLQWWLGPNKSTFFPYTTLAWPLLSNYLRLYCVNWERLEVVRSQIQGKIRSIQSSRLSQSLNLSSFHSILRLHRSNHEPISSFLRIQYATPHLHWRCLSK